MVFTPRITRNIFPQMTQISAELVFFENHVNGASDKEDGCTYRNIFNIRTKFVHLYQHGVTECFGEPCNTHLDTLYGFCRWLPIACHIVAQLLAVDARSFRQACKGKRRIFEERHRVKNILKFQTIEIEMLSRLCVRSLHLPFAFLQISFSRLYSVTLTKQHKAQGIVIRIDVEVQVLTSFNNRLYFHTINILPFNTSQFQYFFQCSLLNFLRLMMTCLESLARNWTIPYRMVIVAYGITARPSQLLFQFRIFHLTPPFDFAKIEKKLTNNTFLQK